MPSSLLSITIHTSKAATARIPIAKRNTAFVIKTVFFAALCASVLNVRTKQQKSTSSSRIFNFSIKISIPNSISICNSSTYHSNHNHNNSIISLINKNNNISRYFQILMSSSNKIIQFLRCHRYLHLASTKLLQFPLKMKIILEI